MSKPENIDLKTVDGFGQEWRVFDQTGVQQQELQTLFGQYFAIFPWAQVNLPEACAADFGCGSGRWSRILAPRIRTLHVVDASVQALQVARENLKEFSNIEYHRASIERTTIPDASLDFAFSLGVLHHLPDTAQAICDISTKLKAGAPFLIYVYYSLENRPLWYRALWKLSHLIRRQVSRWPFPLKKITSLILASSVYWPFARTAKILEKLGIPPQALPLSYYRNLSFYIMRNDALDRFGTRVEHRFSKLEIKDMLEDGGFESVKFSHDAPFWCAVAFKKARINDG